MRAAFAVLLAIVQPASAQVVHGTVVAADGGTPIPGAVATARTSGATASADRLGRFAVVLTRLPDTLVVTAIGWAPDTQVVADPRPLLIVRLRAAPVALSDLIAVAPAVQPLTLAPSRGWRMPMAAARTVPPAVETDPFRALALVPAVSFSSPLSARPHLRGYDAQEVTTRIDGFEVLNLYHLGRVFSSMPADAVDAVTVSPAPSDPSIGNTIAGLIDLAGNTGRTDGWHGGGAWSYGALNGFGGGGGDRTRVFGAARAFYWKSLDLIPGVDIPYQFEDVYAGAVFGPSSRPTGRITAFATRDRAGDTDTDRFLTWNNVLLGGRWRVIDAGAATIEVSASGARFRQEGLNVPGLHQQDVTDLSNDFGRLGGAVDLALVSERTRVGIGTSLGWRRIRNRIEPSGHGAFRSATGGPSVATSLARAEIGSYAQLSRRTGPLVLEASARIDVAGEIAMLQPALAARWSHGRVEISASAGRSARLYHLLAEARSEPDFDFVDIWLPAGKEIPAARADHASVDLTLDLSRVVARVSGYRSAGVGIGELRPSEDQRPGPFESYRFGRSRTRGLEVQLAVRNRTASGDALSVTYVLARSERNFGRGWRPWALDRRHQFRAFGQTRFGRLTTFAAIDAASGLPVTPIDFVLGPSAFSDRTDPRPVYGAENGAVPPGTIRVDAGFALTARGPRRSRMTLGASVINLLHTAVAPFGEEGDGPPALDQAGRPTALRRIFSVPPVPTLTVRLEF